MNNPSLTAMAFGLQDGGKCPVCQKYYGWNGGWCACPVVDWIGCASQFTFNEIPANQMMTLDDYPIHIERCRNREGAHLWAVRTLSDRVLNHQGEWEFEPIPSSRDEAFLKRCRFATKEAAHAAMEKRERIFS